MKNYYCVNCRKFKSTVQVKRTDDTRTRFYVCKWCHSSNIYRTEDILTKLVNKTLTDDDLNGRRGSFL